jgi:co-chaperonin GroES (HSP10)
MIKLKPQGVKIIVHPIEIENYKTETGIEVVQLDLQEGEVVEVSDELKDIYKKGDIVLYSKGSGLGVVYQKKNCIFLSGEGNGKGDILAIIER